MSEFIIEIKPKKPEFDPLAKRVKATLMDWGRAETESEVETKRLFKLAGPLTEEDAKKVSDTLLIDSVVETGGLFAENKSKRAAGGWIVEVWPRQGVTDPIGETVEKGIRDLGIKGEIHAHAGTEYVFSGLSDENFITEFARQQLGNQLIHDIHIRKNK